MEEYIINNSKNYKISNIPFPHIYIENFMPPEYYGDLLKEVKNLNWWKGYDGEDMKEKWNRYTITSYYKKDYLNKPILKKYQEVFSNKKLQKHFLDLFESKRNNNLPKNIHIQLDTLKMGMDHALHCDKLPKYLTFVHYLAEDDKYPQVGTKIYDFEKKYVDTAKYLPNSCLIFAPNENDKIKTWHNMELKIENLERRGIQTWFLYEDYKTKLLPFEGNNWTRDQKFLKKRKDTLKKLNLI